MSLTDLRAELLEYKAARTAILAGAQSYSIAGRSLTRANLDIITQEIARIEARIGRVSRNTGAVKAPLFEG